MVGGNFIIREATGADMPGIARVHSSVRENLLTSEQLAERAGEIVACSMADRENGSLFALFVLPEYEGRGLGSRLMDLALQWLWDTGTECAWLTTSPDTRAARFHAHRNWTRFLTWRVSLVMIASLGCRPVPDALECDAAALCA
jgi:GNAT superfamily N-acetyltransferase